MTADKLPAHYAEVSADGQSQVVEAANMPVGEQNYDVPVGAQMKSGF